MLPLRTHLGRRLRFCDERGQAIVEFALVLPILALLLFGIIQFGLVFNNYVTLTDAVRAGARKAAVSRQSGNPVGDTQTAVRNAASDLDLSQLTITVTSSWAPAEDVVVKGCYPYSIDLVGVVLKSGSMCSTTTERVE
jgi:Flp pilus assembly protein TadG